MKKRNPWLDFADEDLKMAQAALAEKVYNQVCFHSQQGVEKLLKGFLTARGKSISKTHSLLELMNHCAKVDRRFKSYKDLFRELDKFYIVTRYPDALPGSLPKGLPNKEDAEEALKSFNKVKTLIG